MTSIDTISSSPSVYPQKPCLSCFAGVNDVLMRIAVTGILFFWLGLIFMILFAILFESLFDIHDGYWFIATPLIASLLTTGVCVCFLNRFTWRKHALSEQKERRFSMLAGAYWGYFLTVIYLFIFPCKGFYTLCLLVLLPLVGIGVGARFPIYGCPKLWRRFVCTLVFWFLTFLPFGMLTQLVPSRPFNYSGDRFPQGLSTFFFHDYAHFMRSKIPDGATDIEIKGVGFGHRDEYTWRCRIPEADFLAFAKERHYRLDDRIVDYNMNHVVWDTLLDSIKSVDSAPYGIPVSSWIYCNSQRNKHGGNRYGGGGLFFLYDRTTGLLHGFYSAKLYL